MQLTQGLLDAIDAGQAIPLTIEGRDCVLLPEGIYEQLRAAIDDWNPATMQHNMAAVMKEDWTDPAMSIYDE